MKYFICITMMATLLGCDVDVSEISAKGEDRFDKKSLSDAPIQGIIGGKKWTAKTTQLKQWGSESDRWVIQFFEEEADSFCGPVFRGRKLSIIFTPTSDGKEAQELVANFNFQTEQGVFVEVTDEVLMKIDPTQGNKFTGQVLAEIDASNKANGRFEADLCFDY